MFTRLIVGVSLALGLMGLGACSSGVPADGAALRAIAFAEPAAPFAGFDPLDGALIRDPANSYDLEIPLQPDLGPRSAVSESSQEATEVDAPFADPFAEEPPPVPDDLPPGAVTTWFDLDGGMEDVPLPE